MRPYAPEEVLAAAARGEQLSSTERAEVGRTLRRLGWTYGEIREVLPVPKGTLAGWCRGIVLTPDQQAAIQARTGARRRGVPRDTQHARRAEIRQIRAEARAFALEHMHNPLFVGGTVLYWGEGAKTEPALAVANSDPAALCLFISWVRRFHRRDAAFVLSLHLHEGNDEPLARQWWAERLRLRDPAFTKTYIKPPGTGHRKNHLPHGICKVRLRRGADAWHRTMAWIDALKEELGLES